MAERRRIEKRKYPRLTGGVIEVDVVTEDEYGTWFFAPAGIGNRHSLDGLLLLPRDVWWVAWWWRDNDLMCTVDVVVPARIEGDRWIYDDLEIDLAMRESDGIVQVVDVDEFAAAVTTVPYPPELIVGAVSGMRDAERRMTAMAPPFDSGFQRLRASVNGSR